VNHLYRNKWNKNKK